MENVIITVRIRQNIFGNIYVYTNKYNKLNTEVIVMSIFDETVVKAKEVLDIAGKKTNDIISVQKIKMLSLIHIFGRAVFLSSGGGCYYFV